MKESENFKQCFVPQAVSLDVTNTDTWYDLCSFCEANIQNNTVSLETAKEWWPE